MSKSGISAGAIMKAIEILEIDDPQNINYVILTPDRVSVGYTTNSTYVSMEYEVIS